MRLEGLPTDGLLLLSQGQPELLLLTWGGEAGGPPYIWAAAQPGTARTRRPPALPRRWGPSMDQIFIKASVADPDPGSGIRDPVPF